MTEALAARYSPEDQHQRVLIQECVPGLEPQTYGAVDALVRPCPPDIDPEEGYYIVLFDYYALDAMYKMQQVSRMIVSQEHYIYVGGARVAGSSLFPVGDYYYVSWKVHRKPLPHSQLDEVMHGLNLK